MKYAIQVSLAAFIVLALVSCTKNSAVIRSAYTGDITIMGKWNLVSDSTFAGVGAGNHAVNYTGQSGDYVDFNNDGNVYIKEGSNVNVYAYHNVSDTSLIIESFGITLNGVPETCLIEKLTIDHATISAPWVYTPGGTFGRTVTLSR